MTKILFLDIDGVINSTRSLLAFGDLPDKLTEAHLFDHCALGLVRKLCKETETKVVISSMWRLHATAKEFADVLELPVIGLTPEGNFRGEEIENWLAANRCDAFAIVDDIAQFYDYQSSHVVLTDSDEGLTYKNYRQLFEILGTEEQRKRYLSKLVIF